jgi:sugar-specific transcriptional regulator TrmB
MEIDKPLIDLLQELGVRRTEAMTYDALLQAETVSIRKIASATGINRGTTYDALKRLIVLGLVNVRAQGEREYYTAESPEKIFELIRDKRRNLLDAHESAKDIIPKLLSKHIQPTGKPLVRYYEGDDGIATVLRDVLETCRGLDKPNYYAYSSSVIRQYIYRDFPQFTERRVAEGIDVKVIAAGEGGEPAAYSERKWLAQEVTTDLSSYTLIYGNKVATISISDDFTPYAVVVEDRGATSMQRLLFEQLWNCLPTAMPEPAK